MSCKISSNTSTFLFYPYVGTIMKQTEIDTYIGELGKRIRKLRKEQGMTQLDLATTSDIDVRQIQRLENGHTSATLKTLLKITSGLNINLIELFKFTLETTSDR